MDGPAWKNARGPAQVVYDCPQIVIVNKPAGLAVDGPEDDTLLNRTLLYLNQQGEYKENDLYTPALCHRLDTGTSGLVIVAKTPEAEDVYKRQAPQSARPAGQAGFPLRFGQKLRPGTAPRRYRSG